MAEEISVETTEGTQQTEEERSTVSATVRSVLLASIGALALSKEELDKILARLVEKGELTQKEAQKVIDEVLERQKKEASTWEQRLASELEKRMESVLKRLNMPTRKDIEALEAQIETLSKKLEELHAKESVQGENENTSTEGH